MALALAIALLAVPPDGLAAEESEDIEPQTVSSFSIDEPTEDVHLSGLPADFETTFTTAASHVLGRYRAIIWLQGPEQVDLGVRTIPLPITGWSPSGPVTQTESLTVPAGTPQGTYTLCIRAEENYPPGSESWGYSRTDCLVDRIHIDGVIDTVEFTQAIQGEQDFEDIEENGPAVPIIEGRPGVMRVYTEEVEEASDLTIQVSGSVNGSRSLPLSPGCDREDQRRNQGACQSFDFPFPSADGSMDVQVEARDSEGNVVDERELSFSTESTVPIEITPVSVCDEFEVALGPLPIINIECQDAATVGAMLGFAEAVFPVADVSTTAPGGIVVLPAPTTGDRDDERDWWSDVNAEVRRLRNREGDQGTQRHWYGAVREEVPGTINGIGSRPTIGVHDPLDWLTAAGRTSQPRHAQTLAHEVGHNRTLFHAPCGGPANPDPNWPDNDHPDARINDVGYDVMADRLIDGIGDDYRDLMAYCQPRWISAYHYNRLIEQLAAGGGVQAESSDLVTAAADGVWEIAGVVEDDGSVALDPIFRYDDAPTAGNTGDWTVEVRDAAGDVLADHRFSPLAPITGDETGRERFHELVPVDAGAAALAIVDPDGSERSTVTLGGDAPSVTVTAPAGGEVWDGTGGVSWSADDPDGDDLWYSVDYSSDGGQTWQSILHKVGAEGAEIDFAALPGGAPGDSRIRVHASDGVNTAAAVSDGFTVPGKAPTIEITAPADGDPVRADAAVWLRASAFDADDGALSGASLTWESDLDGLLGEGRNLPVTLSEGSHVITVTVTDSDGSTASDQIGVVADGTPPAIEVRLDGEPPSEGPGEVLVLRTTSVSASLETSLLEIGVDFDTRFTSDFASVDLEPYDTIVVGIDGGAVGDDDLLALRQAVDDGKRVVGFGGVANATFVEAADEHLFAVDTSATSWRMPSSPHFEVVDADHPLARRLPESHDFSTMPDQFRNPAEYVLRVTDPDVDVVATNGDGDPVLVSGDGGALTWMVNTPNGALWGDPADTLMLDQLLANATELETIVDGPVTVTIDAEDLGGSGLDWLDYSLDGGQTWTTADVSDLPHGLDVAEEGRYELVVRAHDAVRNLSIDTYRFFVEAPPDPVSKDDCKSGGWETLGFPNQGQCVRFYETGKDPAPE